MSIVNLKKQRFLLSDVSQYGYIGSLMSASTISHQSLIDLLNRSLSQPAARAGLRLRSERELAAALGVGRRRVAWAMGKLAQQGVVTRRVGDGTYLCRAPLESQVSPEGEVIPLEKLFYESLAAETDVLERAGKEELKLGICWLSLGEMSRANRLTLEGMMARALELGHTLTFHNVETPNDPDGNMLIEQLSRQRFDGVLACAIHYVQLRVQRVTGRDGKSVPSAYFYTADVPLGFDPVITLNAGAAVELGVAQLAAQGHGRIGLIGLETMRLQSIYDAAMREAGLDFRAACIVPPPKGIGGEIVVESTVVRQGKAATLEMLDLHPDLEAVYVADDILMLGVAEALSERGIVPGRDLGVIALGTIGGPAAPGYVWSQVAMDPRKLGRMAVDLMIDVIRKETQGMPVSVRLDPRWCPGETHGRK